VTQPAKRFDVWRRLYTRFGIEPFPADGEGPAVSTTIIPVTDADILQSVTRFVGGNMNLSGAAGTFVSSNTVPDGKVWRVKGVHRDLTIAVSLVELGTSGLNMPVTGLGTADEFQALPDIRLAEGEQVGMLTTGDGGDALVGMRTAIEEEDVF